MSTSAPIQDSVGLTRALSELLFLHMSPYKGLHMRQHFPCWPMVSCWLLLQLALTNSCVPTGWYKLLLILLTTVNGSNVSTTIECMVSMNIN